MELNKIKKLLYVLPLAALFVVLGCKVSYKFTGASIDYSIVKTISLETFQNRAPYQWGPMATMLNEKLSDVFVQQTKLTQVKRGGDLQLAGEIISYDQVNKSISSDGYSAMVQLKMSVNVRFVNNKNHEEDFERTFSATRDFDSSQLLETVQEELVTQMIDEIVEAIFNAAVANW